MFAILISLALAAPNEGLRSQSQESPSDQNNASSVLLQTRAAMDFLAGTSWVVKGTEYQEFIYSFEKKSDGKAMVFKETRVTIFGRLEILHELLIDLESAGREVKTIDGRYLYKLHGNGLTIRDLKWGNRAVYKIIDDGAELEQLTGPDSVGEWKLRYRTPLEQTGANHTKRLAALRVEANQAILDKNDRMAKEEDLFGAAVAGLSRRATFKSADGTMDNPLDVNSRLDRRFDARQSQIGTPPPSPSSSPTAGAAHGTAKTGDKAATEGERLRFFLSATSDGMRSHICFSNIIITDVPIKYPRPDEIWNSYKGRFLAEVARYGDSSGSPSDFRVIDNNRGSSNPTIEAMRQLGINQTRRTGSKVCEINL